MKNIYNFAWVVDVYKIWVNSVFLYNDGNTDENCIAISDISVCKKSFPSDMAHIGTK